MSWFFLGSELFIIYEDKVYCVAKVCGVAFCSAYEGVQDSQDMGILSRQWTAL